MAQVSRVIGDARVLDIVQEVLASHADTARPVWPEGGELFDHREQPARLEPQQQRSHEREQQRGLPSRKPLWQDGETRLENWPDSWREFPVTTAPGTETTRFSSVPSSVTAGEEPAASRGE